MTNHLTVLEYQRTVTTAHATTRHRHTGQTIVDADRGRRPAAGTRPARTDLPAFPDERQARTTVNGQRIILSTPRGYHHGQRA